MNTLGLGFITHHEVDALTGGSDGGAQRRRLAKRGLFPSPPKTWLIADRDRLAIFPEFALAALAIQGRPTQRQLKVLKAGVKAANQLYSGRAYRGLASVLLESLQMSGSRDVTALTMNVLDLDSNALSAWRADVSEVMSRLDKGLRLEVSPAWVADVSTSGYVVELKQGGQELHDRLNAPLDLLTGSCVTRDRLHVGSSMREFLLPVPDLSKHEWMIETAPAANDTASNEEEAFVDQILGGDESVYRAIPHLGAARMEPVAAAHPEPQIRVEIPRDLMLGANTMSRSPRRA